MNEKKSQGLRFALLAIALTLTAWTPQVRAFTATVTTHAHLRAGPSIEYPSVALLPPGVVVQVYGCEQGYGWCDASLGLNRGWIDSAYLQAAAPNGPVVLSSGAVMLGIPIVAFSFNTYWNTYYRGRPWYGQRAHYYNYWNRYPHGRPPPPPRPPPSVRPPPPRPPPPVRPPPHPRPPPNTGRPPGGRPPPSGGKPPPGGGGGGKPPPGGGGGGGRPPSGGGPPGGGKPPPGNRPPPSTRPAPTPGQ
jgi:uncharacterized protein YraI